MPRFSPRLAARSRSHAGCALAGDPLAMSVCGQTPFRDHLSVFANGLVQTNAARNVRVQAKTDRDHLSVTANGLVQTNAARHERVRAEIV